MKNKLVIKTVGVGAGALLFAVTVALWKTDIPFTSAAQVSISEVRVTVCGDGVTEGAEQCDPGRHCQNLATCATNADCVNIGDNLCSTRSFGSCSNLCEAIVGSHTPPPPTFITLTTIQLRPEQRSLSNYSTEFYLTVLNADNLNRQVVYQHPFALLANSSGLASPYITLPDSVPPGVYDILIKSKSHLAKVLNNVYLQDGDNALNFTNADNGPSIGSEVLVAGDIDGAGNSQATFGDNVINAVDLSIMLGQVGNADPAGQSRANLNRDPALDQTDLNILLNNLDKDGDR